MTMPTPENKPLADQNGRVAVPSISIPAIDGITLTLRKASYVNHP